MIQVINDSHDPFFNLALEEYYLNESDSSNEILILWQNEPTIVIGRHQNTSAEINLDFVAERGIHLIRRMSGGGAVYHDLGNLNFSFISVGKAERRNDFAFFAQPVVSALQALGLNAEFAGRNDIKLNGQKISGNAQYFSGDRILHHGTILFNTDMTVLSQALKNSEGKFSSRAVKSIASPVTNIFPHLSRDISLAEFKTFLAKEIFKGANAPIKVHHPSADEISSIETIAERRYRTWEWNFGASPPSNYRHSAKFIGGAISLSLNIVEGKIRDCRFYGDFFAKRNISELEGLLENCPYQREATLQRLSALDAASYFSNISKDEILSCFFPNVQ